MVGIYMIKNKCNDKKYIGQSKDIHNRWIRHRSELKHNSHINKHLQNAYNKYGDANFEYNILEICDIDELNEKEIYYINKYDSYENGYNLCIGGSGNLGYKHSEEEIEKMRLIQNPPIVLQLDKNLNIVNEWIGISHAAKTLNISKRNIEACCNQLPQHKTAYGYFWFYKDDYINNKIDFNYYLSQKQTKKEGKFIKQIDPNTKQIINTFDSIMEAHRELKINRQSIQYCLNGKQKLAKGFIFEYA